MTVFVRKRVFAVLTFYVYSFLFVAFNLM